MTPGTEGGQAPWPARRGRAAALRAERPHAAALLDSYLGVIELQEPLYARARQDAWPMPGTPEADASSGLRLERLPFESLDQPFGRFVRDVRPVMPKALAPTGAALESADPRLRADLLKDCVARRPLSNCADTLRTETAPLEFFSLAFLQPIAEALASRLGALAAGRTGTCCPLCGWPPQLALLRDEPDVKGHRSLVCALCSTEWGFARSACVNCGEADAERLEYHVSDTLPHVRIEACKSCRTYLKVVDLRAEGTQAPAVDEIASIELDLWCGEQGLIKLQPNLFGM